ncbi:MAG: hypothetical protein A2901_04645 [Elusimicrobia bacterium RIFCSPLOWO2_01_FULL_54_10]|nr:MAG: hypothetical protein A2901_04645 [Elusimicrobia bacterium RIFCSPLOWO2_01_FULL_54_10]
MPKKLKKGIVCMAGTLALYFICHPQNLSSTPSENQPLLMPTFFSDALKPTGIDARDAQNRPLRQGKAALKLKTLFDATVVQLLTVQDLPVVSMGRNVLRELARPIQHFLGKARRWLPRTLEIAVLFNVKRLIEKIKFGSAGLMLAMALSVFGLRFCQTRFLVANLQPQLIPLRC